MGKIKSHTADALKNLRPPLTEGEQKVLDFFKRKLSDDWEIYLQPYLNGCRPDFVLLNPKVGIAVYEVKDWDLTLYERNSERRRWITVRDGKRIEIHVSPVEQIRRYKKEIVDLYCPREDGTSSWNVATAGLIFTKATEKRLKELRIQSESPQQVTIVGIEALQSNDIKRVFPEAVRKTSRYMTERMAADLRSWLIEPDHSAEQREPLETDFKQRALIETRTKSGRRRIRGPAGSGKSVVLAARAAELAHEGKRVLVVSFNITLWHYLRDLCARWRVGKEETRVHPNKITWLHFHALWERMVVNFGLNEDYNNIWKKSELTNDEKITKEIPKVILDKLQNMDKSEIKRCTQVYDSILVDEGQDCDPYWWRILELICVGQDKGEMMLVADATQDVYGTAKKWTDRAMKGAGFTGSWNELSISYRMPSYMIKVAAAFTEQFLPESSRLKPSKGVEQTELYEDLKWIQTNRRQIVSDCEQALLDIIREDEGNEQKRAMTDLTLLTEDENVGLAVEKRLNKKGIKCCTTFSDTRDDLNEREKNEKYYEQRRKKMAFWKGDARVKITTFYSFKGWEARFLVLAITQAETPRQLALAYTGLTRIKKHSLGSCLTVVCAAERLEKFGQQWFERFVEKG